MVLTIGGPDVIARLQAVRFWANPVSGTALPWYAAVDHVTRIALYTLVVQAWVRHIAPVTAATSRTWVPVTHAATPAQGLASEKRW